MKPEILAASVLLALPASLLAQAQPPLRPPLLEFSSGLPGKQVRLTWTAETGVRYRIEKSTTLAEGGTGGWKQVDVVDAASTAGLWLDPEPTSTKAFYRVNQPQAEIFSIVMPVLTSIGGDLTLRGQLIPPGSSLLLQIEGQSPMIVPLESLGGGLWRASVAGAFQPGSSVICASIVDSASTTIAQINQLVSVTETGRAMDSPPSLPPAAPVAAMASAMTHSDKFKPQGINAAYLSKKGYDHYNARSDMARSAGENPLFEESGTKGTNPLFESSGLRSNPLYKDKGNHGVNPIHTGSALATNPLYTDSGNQGSNPLFQSNSVRPAPSGIPGEVSFQRCDLALPCPAGPPLAWVCTYRSMGTPSSGCGPGWDFSYNISIESIPANAGATASRIIVRDGGGRADVYQRQADDSFRCSGMFREGKFVNGIFTLTFADTGTWSFHPFDRSPAAGRITAIKDRNGVSLSCSYTATGQLSNVADSFGRSLNVEWTSTVPSRISSVTSSGGASAFAKVTYSYTGADQVLGSVSAPFVPGSPPIAGDTTYTYTSGFSDTRLNNNLLSITDGAGRLEEAFTYSPATTPADISFDACVTHDRHMTAAGGHPTCVSFEKLSTGNYMVVENDELGRVTESVCDLMHRVLSMRIYTGFATPGVPVTSSSNRPAGKLRATDPDFFESSCTYNADSLCTSLTHPDGSKELVTYQRDVKPGGPVRENGNPRVLTLVSPGGEARSVHYDFLPGFGNPESAMPGNPIKGVSVKCGRNPGGDIIAEGRAARTGRNPQTGKEIKISAKSVAATTDFRDLDSDNDLIPDRFAGGGGDGIPDYRDLDSDNDSISGRISMNVTVGKQTQGATFGEKVGKWVCTDLCLRMVSAHGQVFNWSYDDKGNCTSSSGPIPGSGISSAYNARGQCIATSELNGAAAAFHDEYNYDAATGFLSSVVCDKGPGSTGLRLTTSFDRDPQGRVVRMVEPGGADWLYAYNACDTCVQVQTPAAPNRISMNMTVDNAARIARSDLEHRGPDGSLDASNPLYSTFYVRDSRGRLIRIAEEERPVDASGLLLPDSLGIENFSVCDISYDNAGQCVSLSTPAVCRAQGSVLACDFDYDERGLLHHRIEGGAASTDAITTECDYDAAGALVRCATLDPGNLSPQILVSYDGFHRISSITDEMGNMTTCDYANDGSVTCSIYGQLTDLPGSTGNVLLYRDRTRMSGAVSNPLYSKHAINTKGAGANVGRTASASRNILKSFFTPGDHPTSAQMVCSGPFFGVAVEDDSFTVERFTPGAPGNPVTETTLIHRSPAGLVQSVSCNGDTLLTCGYDSAGRTITCDSGYSTCAYTLDANGRTTLCGKTDHFFVVGLPDKTFSHSFSYDALGRCIGTTDGVGNSSHAAYDSLGRCVSSTDPSGLTVTTKYDGSSSAGVFSYQVSADVNGDGTPEILSSSLSRCGELVSVSDSRGFATVYTRDALGRATRCDHPDGTYQTCSYDSRGKLRESRSQDGSVCHFTTDAVGRVTGAEWSASPAMVIPQTPSSYTYDGLGRLVSAARGSSLVTCSFDSCGNPVSETADGRTISRSFSHRGRNGIIYPDGRRYVEARDAFGNLLSVSNASSAGVPLLPPVVTLEYAGSRVVRSTLANGAVTLYHYRGDGEASLPGDLSFDACTKSSVTVNGGSILISDSSTLRNASQQISRSDTVYSSAVKAAGRSTTYEYDALHRLTACVISRREVTGGPVLPESSVSYVLDLEGRRLSATGGENPGGYTQSGDLPPGDLQMSQYTSWPGGPLAWDDNGNLTTIDVKGSTCQIRCDSGFSFVSCTNTGTGGTIVSYDYDALGRRVGRNPQTGKRSTFIYDGSTCIQELEQDSTGTLGAAVSFICADGVQQGIVTRDGTLFYLHGGIDDDCDGIVNEKNHVETWGDPHEYVNGKQKVEHSGDPHEYLNGRTCPGGGRVWPTAGYLTMVTTSTGGVLERFDRDDAGRPLFLTGEGLPSSASSAVGPIRWMAPEAIWEPELGMFSCPDGLYSPALGRTATSTSIPAGFVTKKNFGQLAGKK